MPYQFQCPFCQTSIEAETGNKEFTVECPVCSQSFVVEAPRQAVRVKATVVPAANVPAAHHHAPHAAHATSAGRHPSDHARRAERRAKLGIAAMLTGGPLILGGMVWVVMSLKEAREKERERDDARVVARQEKENEARVEKFKQALEKKRQEDAGAAARTAELDRKWREDQAREVEFEARQRRNFMRDTLAREMFQGDKTVAEEAARELEEAEKQVAGLYSDGILSNEPANYEQKVRQVFLERLLANRKIMNWAQGRSLPDYARHFLEGGFRGPDGRPLDPNSVQAMLASGKYRGTGSAFWISRDGWLLTNAHVTGGTSSVDLRLDSGKIINAHVVKSDKAKDLSLLKAETATDTWLPITGGEPKVGLKVVAAGFPRPSIQGVECKITSGDINSLSGEMDNADHMQCSIPVFPGNSGGPMLETTTGWVVGVICAKIEDHTPGIASGSVSYAIKAGVVRNFIMEVPEARALLEKMAAPKNANGFDESIARAKKAAVMVLVK